MVMTHTYADQGQRSLSSKVQVERNGRTDRRSRLHYLPRYNVVVIIRSETELEMLARLRAGKPDDRRRRQAEDG